MYYRLNGSRLFLFLLLWPLIGFLFLDASLCAMEAQAIPIRTLLKDQNRDAHAKRNVIDLSSRSLTSLERLHLLLCTNGKTILKAINLSNLQLYLANNKLKSLPIDLIELTNLEELELQHNLLKDISLPIACITSLKKLDLSHNQIELSETDLSNLSHLIALNVSHNKLKTISAPLLHLTNLTKLDVSGNKISQLPIEIRLLIALEKLDLSSTEIDLSPQTIDKLSHLTKLRTLKLCANKLKQLPENFGSLRSLVRIHLDNNELTDLPASLGQLDYFNDSDPEQKLQDTEKQMPLLSLSHNCFVLLPSILFKLAKLAKLYLDHNMIEKLPDNMHDLEGLLYLDLSSNRLKALPEMYLNRLVFLILNDNQLTELPKCCGSLSLWCLEARHNLLTSLPASLTEMHWLGRLDLRDNKLGITNNGIYMPVLSLDDISLTQNTLTTNLDESAAIPAELTRGHLEKLVQPLSPNSKHRVLLIGDPHGYLLMLPRAVLLEVYKFQSPPLKRMRFCRAFLEYEPQTIIQLFQAIENEIPGTQAYYPLPS